MTDQELAERNKAVVRRFNDRVIGALDRSVYDEIFDHDFINHSASPGSPIGREGMWQTFANVLQPAMPDLRVIIDDQLADGDKVVTRKTISGTHLGPLLGVAPTGKPISIAVIDIVRLRDGRYLEHWGINTLAAVLAQLRA